MAVELSIGGGRGCWFVLSCSPVVECGGGKCWYCSACPTAPAGPPIGMSDASDRKLVVEELHKKDSVADKRPLNGLVQGELRKIVGIGGSRDRPPLSGMPFVDRTYLTRDGRSKESGRLL